MIKSTTASTRESILKESVRIFAELGFEGATTRKIADGAGVNVGLIKYYFGSKELLWQEAVDRAFAEMHAALGDTLTGLEDLPGERQMRVLARRFALFVSQNPETVRFMQDAGTHDGARMRWLVDKHLRPVFDLLRASIVARQKEGLFPAGIDPLHLFYVLVGSMSLVFHQAPECLYLTGADPRDPAVAEAHAEAMVRLFAPAAYPDPRKARR